MIFYILLIAFIVFFWFFLRGFEYKPRLKIYAFVVSAVLWALLALKGGGVGNDTNEYIRIFDTAGTYTNFFENTTRYETGYIVFNRVILLFTNNVQFLFVIVAIIMIFAITRIVLDNSPKAWLSFTLLVTLRMFFFLMSGLRQSLALALIFMSYGFIKKRKPIPFVLLILLASLFHFSAIIFLIVYPLSYLRFKPLPVMIVSSAAVALYLVFDQFLSLVFYLFPSYSHYQDSRYFGSNTLANYLIFLFILAFLLLGVFMRYTAREDSPAQKGAPGSAGGKAFSAPDTLSYIMLLSVCVALLATRASMLDRMLYYFWAFGILYIPDVLSRIKDKKAGLLITQLVVVITAAYCLITLYYRPDWAMIVPYRFFWQ